MTQKFHITLRNFVPILLFAFVICGVGGMYCPMPASATDASHSQPTAHHSSSSSQTTGECPDLLTTSAESFEKDDIFVGVLSAATITWLEDLPHASVLQFLGNDRTPQATNYPLLFLLFSVFLN